LSIQDVGHCTRVCTNVCKAWFGLTYSKTRSPAVARIDDQTGSQWPSRSSKVDDFHFTESQYATSY